MLSRRLRGAALALAAVIAIGGCSPSGADQSAESTAGVRELLSPPAEIGDAFAVSEQECARAAGFEPPLTVPEGARSVSLAGMPGAVRAESAATSGYGFGEEGGSGAPIDAWLNSLPSAERREYLELINPSDGRLVTIETPTGTMLSRPATGCAAQASQEIYGSVEADLRLQAWISDFISASNGFSLDDPAIVDATAAYAACMSAAGFAVTSVEEARALAIEQFEADRLAGEPITGEEITMATTDAGCQDSSGLIASYEEARLAAAGQFLADHEGELLGFVQAQQEARDRARALLTDAR